MYETLRKQIAELEAIKVKNPLDFNDYESGLAELKDELRWLEQQDYMEYENPDYYRAY